MKKRPGLLSLLRPYRGLVSLLVAFSLISNGASLILPRLVGLGINQFALSGSTPIDIARQFAAVSMVIFLFTALQSVMQIYTSERVARDLRQRLAHKISQQNYAFVVRSEPSRLLTNLTSDVDAVKTYVADVIVGLLSSLMILTGATLMLLHLNWRLGLAVLSVVPLIGLAFGLVLSRLRPIFRQTRQVIDRLNKVIHESVAGAALVRVLHGGPSEGVRFADSNQLARALGMKILHHFALLIPVINITAQLASVVILALGGRYVIGGSMSVGDLATFYGYLALVIFPIFVIGFMNGMIAQASAAFERLTQVLDAPEPAADGGLTAPLSGHLEATGLSLSYGERLALGNVSLTLRPGTRTAVLGPTAAGKTQLLYLLTGLLTPDSGTIRVDGHGLDEYDKTSLHRQLAIVFQESVLFNLSIRDNIAFSDQISPEAWQRAVDTAELQDFLDQLPEGADTQVSERGTRLSGGQKQRLMLARALALEPAILLLDDFTARVDPATERKILGNLRRNYPQLTLLAVTQRISTVQDYEHILLLMEGSILAQGTHLELLDSSPEYMQIFESQKSTQEYELSSDRI
ncbi:ABC transporter ATP-binding protein [bacterium]|nr:ABC transporter ATP-binding protein [bacterium]